MESRRKPRKKRSDQGSKSVEAKLRVIGGDLRGRTIPYLGERQVRPMKDRVREAVFNLLGPRVVGKCVIDLFAGTGAMTFESLSRRSARAVLFERRFPTSRQIAEAAATFGLSDRVEISTGDTFVWAKQLPEQPELPWLVFCCPPYELFVSQLTELRRLLERLWTNALPESVFVIESDERFDATSLFPAASWNIRPYPPAVIGIVEKRPANVAG